MSIWYSDANPHRLCIVDGSDIAQFKDKEGTCNECEYRAAIWAMEWMKSGDTLLSDSQLVVNQVTNGWKVKARNLRDLNTKAKQLLKEKNLTLKWIEREQNKAGHLL